MRELLRQRLTRISSKETSLILFDLDGEINALLTAVKVLSKKKKIRQCLCCQTWWKVSELYLNQIQDEPVTGHDSRCFKVL